MSTSAVATSEPVAPFARRRSSRAGLRRARFVQRFVSSILVVATALAWSRAMHNAPYVILIGIPGSVAASALALFARRPWLSLLPRAALWMSAFWGCAATFLSRASGESPDVAILAVVACAGLLSLGRFARTIGGMRPLLAALVALSLADALMTSAFALSFVVEGAHVHDEIAATAVFASVAVANAVGVFFIVKQRVFWPHIVGNFVVVVVNVLDVAKLDPLNWVLAVPACVQIVLAIAQRLPRASPRMRRASEWAMRTAIVVAAIAVVVTVARR